MPIYTCERCLKEFSQKSHYNKHKIKKFPCQNNKGKIEQVIKDIIIDKKIISDNIGYELNYDKKTNIKIKNNENELEQFYTNPDIALKCYNKLKEIIDINNYDIHLEPSAGEGSFFNIMDNNKKFGLDIEPNHKDINKMDFFDYKPFKNKNT